MPDRTNEARRMIWTNRILAVLAIACVTVSYAATTAPANSAGKHAVSVKPVTPVAPVKRLPPTVMARPGELPYQVSVRYAGRHHCGGAIISKRHILTSATCVTSMVNLKNAAVVTGSTNINEGQIHKVKKIVPNGAWNRNIANHVNDIALIALWKEIPFDNNQTSINVPIAPLPDRCTVAVAGWTSKSNPKSQTTHLNLARVRTMSHEECYGTFRRNHIPWENQICTYGLPGFGMCLGDEGAPLVFNAQIVGVLSGGTMCTRGYASAFTSVYHNLNWLNFWVQNT